MRVYRLTLPGYVNTAFSGEGALRVGGRWTPAGYRTVHTADSIALALLETLVHAPSPVTPIHRAITVEVPDALAITTIEPCGLPAEWRNMPPIFFFDRFC